MTPPTPQNVTLGSLINLTCIVTGAPQPRIEWLKGGQILTGRNLPYFVIEKVTPEDRGQYRCRATNSEGTAQSSNVLVTIQGMSITY